MIKRSIFVLSMVFGSSTASAAESIKCTVVSGWLKDSYSISDISISTGASTAQLRVKGKLGKKDQVKSQVIGIGVKHTWSQTLTNYNKNKDFALDFVVRHKTKTDSVDFSVYYNGRKTPSNSMNCFVE